MSDEQATRAMALARWKEARSLAHGLFIDLNQSDEAWLLLPGQSARQLAAQLHNQAMETIGRIAAEMAAAQNIWRLQERLIGSDQPGGKSDEREA